MLLRITLWALLLGSIILGFFGYQTGSTTTTIVGITAMIFIVFLLYFIVKMSLAAGLVFVKVVIIVLLTGGVILLCVKGCNMVFDKGRQVSHSVAQKSYEIKGKIEKPSLFANWKSFFGMDKDVQPSSAVVQNNQPTHRLLGPKELNGKVTGILSGNVFKMGNIYVKLYGIDVPMLRQKCIDLRGESYRCGHIAKQKLERLLMNKQLNCQVVSQYSAQEFVATCSIKGYDIGASMVTVGWAVADRRVTDAYVPYESAARKDHKGLWAGKFVAPWVYASNNGTYQNGTKSKKGFLEGLLK